MLETEIKKLTEALQANTEALLSAHGWRVSVAPNW